MSIHKSQGLSLDCVKIDIGNKILNSDKFMLHFLELEI